MDSGLQDMSSFFFFQDLSSDLHIVTKELSKCGQVPWQFGSNFGICKIGGLDEVISKLLNSEIYLAAREVIMCGYTSCKDTYLDQGDDVM